MSKQFTVGQYHEERGTYRIDYFSDAINEMTWIEVFPEYSIEDILQAIMFNEMSYDMDDPSELVPGEDEFQQNMLNKRS